MARIPGTETPKNRAGWRPGDAVRGRRARAAAAQGVADRRGLVTEVRMGNVRVMFEPGHPGLWLSNELLVAADDVGQADLDSLADILRRLDAVRLERDEDDLLTVYCEELSAEDLDGLREALGPRLASLSIAAHGVHELAVRLRLNPT